MLARILSGALMGIDAVVVEVEVDMSLGLPFFNVVGLPEGAVRESKVRVVSALKNAGFDLPQKRITVNLAPADLRKEGAAFDLPIALGVLAAANQLPAAPLGKYLFGGELSLDGSVKPIRGVLALALAALSGGFEGVMVPSDNYEEAALVEGIRVIPVPNLQDAVAHLEGTLTLSSVRERPALGIRATSPDDEDGPDLADVRGQEDIKNVLEMAAAGGHNVLMCGPPGSGKTMLARRLPGILPRMTFSEAVEVTKIYSVLGQLTQEQQLVGERPFRSPHHTISDAGLVGGGPLTRPGELSMAHHGVLFLDELPEFRRNVLEILRQPLEEGVVHLARANQHVTFPAQVMLVAAMNPCPCGYFLTDRKCSCPPVRVNEYHSRVSGPLLDRIDVTLPTRALTPQDIASISRQGKPSSHYRQRVEAARERQRHRFRDAPSIHSNAQMLPKHLRLFCRLQESSRKALEEAVRKHGLSARAHDRILKLSRTRADLEGREHISDQDVLLAVECRKLDRKGFLDPNSSENAKTEEWAANVSSWRQPRSGSGS